MDAMTASACHPAAQPRPWGRRKMDAMTASARRPAAQPGPGRRLQIDAMTASAPHLAAQPGPERRRRRCAMTASAAQCPGSWSRKGGANRTGSQVQWRAAELSVGSRVETLEGENGGWRGYRGVVPLRPGSPGSLRGRRKTRMDGYHIFQLQTTL